MATVTVFPAGVTATGVKPGDFGLTHGRSFVSRGIQVAQRLRFRGPQRQYAHWNHAFLVTGVDGSISEAGGHGIVESHISEYDADDVHLVHVDASDEDRAHVVRYAKDSLGRRYGYLTIVSIAVQLVTGLNVGFQDSRQLICSAYVAGGLVMEGYDWEMDTGYIMPADLAARFGVRP